jgi:hypothetical protein
MTKMTPDQKSLGLRMNDDTVVLPLIIMKINGMDALSPPQDMQSPGAWHPIHLARRMLVVRGDRHANGRACALPSRRLLQHYIDGTQSA